MRIFEGIKYLPDLVKNNIPKTIENQNGLEFFKSKFILLRIYYNNP